MTATQFGHRIGAALGALLDVSGNSLGPLGEALGRSLAVERPVRALGVVVIEEG